MDNQCKTNLGWSPAASRKRQSIRAKWTRSVQARYALFTLITSVAFTAALARRTSIAAGAFVTTWSFLTGNAISALKQNSSVIFKISPIIGMKIDVI